MRPHAYRAWQPEDGPEECRVCGEPERPSHEPDKAAAAVLLPIVGKSDPSSSLEGAAVVEPKRRTKQGRCLALLRSRPGQWIDVGEFVTPEVGGFSGDRRLRELRTAGFPIVSRKDPERESVWQWKWTGEGA